MKPTILTLATALLCASMASCSSYDTSPVAMHAGGYTVARNPTTGMMMGMPNTSRHQAEADKANAFYHRR